MRESAQIATHYDVVVIGAGAGGMNAARQAVEDGRSVLLIEQEDTGGECTWAGCIPSKALIKIADEIATARRYGRVEVDGPAIMNTVRRLIGVVHDAESAETFRDAGVAYLTGRAQFVDPHTVRVADTDIGFTSAVVCTGSSPAIPPVSGLADIDVLTNQNIFHLKDLPASLVVLGAGAIGVELAQAMSRLGVEVTLVEQADQILPKEECAMAGSLAEVLAADGVAVHTATTAVSAYRCDGMVQLSARHAGKEVLLSGEAILVASGRRPNVVELGLELAGVHYDKTGIAVDAHLRTSAPTIYAAGDVVGPLQFSHVGEYQGRMAVRNAFGGDSERQADMHPWCTFTHPELARIGLIESEAREIHGDQVTVYVSTFADIDRAKVDQTTAGWAKVICDGRDRILGASILGERACELLGELLVIKALDQPLSVLFDIVHPFPGYSDVLLALTPRD